MAFSLVPLLLLAVLAAGASLAKGGETVPAADGWAEARSQHFVLYAEASPERARRTVLDLERFRMVLGRILTHLDEAQRVPTTVVLFRNPASFEPYRLDAQGNPLNVDGYCLTTPFQNYLALNGAAPGGRQRVAYHEYVHQVLDAVVGEVPLWLNEGMAEFFSTFDPKGETGKVEFGHPIGAHLATLESQPWIPWTGVVDMTTDSPSYNEGTRQGAFYAQSWLMARTLWTSEDRIRGLGRYMTLLRQGAEPGEAMRSSLGRSAAALGEDAGRLVPGTSEYLVWDLGEAFAKIEVKVKPAAREAVLFRLGDLLARNGTRGAARPHLEAARAAGHPVAPIETALGICAWDEGKHEEASAHFERAIATGQAPAEAYFRRAAAGLEAFDARPRPPEETTAAAREARRTAYRLARGVLEQGLAHHPDDLPSLRLLARTYLPEDQTGPGVAALDRARAIRPLDPEDLAIGVCLLARGARPAEAWGVIEGHIRRQDREQARRAEDCLMAGTMQAIEERIEAGDRDGARELITASQATVPDEQYRSTLTSLAAALDSGIAIKLDRDAPLTETDRYNRGVALARAGDLEAAAKELEALSRVCTEAEICRLAMETAASMRASLARNRQVDRYNEAVGLSNAGAYEKALAILKGLDGSVEDAELREAIVSLRRDLETALAKSRKR